MKRKITINLTNSFIEQGRREGEAKGRTEIILRMLWKRFGKEVEELEERIWGLAPERLDELSEALLDFQSADDLRQWLWRRG